MKKLDKIQYEAPQKEDNTAYKLGNILGYALLVMLFIIIGIFFTKFALWLAGL